MKSVSDSVTGAFMDCHMMVADPARVSRLGLLIALLKSLQLHGLADLLTHSLVMFTYSGSKTSLMPAASRILSISKRREKVRLEHFTRLIHPERTKSS